VEWENTDEAIAVMLKYFDAVIDDGIEGDWRWVLLKGAKK